jgi:hypothetical protein
MRRKAFFMVLFLCVLYLGDALAFWLPIPPGRQQYGVVQIQRYYAMPLKGGKTEYGSDGTETQTCVHSLFPHQGLPPCWYASRKTVRWESQ